LLISDIGGFLVIDIQDVEKGADIDEFETNRLGCIGKYGKFVKRIGIDEKEVLRSRHEKDEV